MFNNNLKELREMRGMTQSQLAKKLQISSSAVGMYEQGRRTPDINMIKKICKVLKIQINQLIDQKIEENSEKTISVDEVIDEITKMLRAQKGLMFSGKIFTVKDKEKIANAIKIATAIAISEN